MDLINAAAIFLRRHNQGGTLECRRNVMLLCSRLSIYSFPSDQQLKR